MKIVHFCLSNFYIDDFSYQENELVAQHVRDGHEVTVVASTETFGADKQLTYLKPSEYVGSDGARVIRLPYRKLFPQAVARKIRSYPNVLPILATLQPDAILFHGTCGWELNTVAQYKRRSQGVALYVDSHEDFNNSAKTFGSKWLLHYPFYRTILRRNIDAIEKILCVNLDAMDFVGDFYGIPKEKLEFFPLGGQVLSDIEYTKLRNEGRSQLSLADRSVLFVQSGKIDQTKKLIESIRAFSQLKSPDAKFVIVGSLQDDIAATAKSLIAQDLRIEFLGWKDPAGLRQLLCAADVYVQPGTQSATMQMALCCRCIVILDDVPSHVPYLQDNGWLVGKKMEIHQAMQNVMSSSTSLMEMSTRSANVANQLLDYKRLAARLYR